MAAPDAPSSLQLAVGPLLITAAWLAGTPASKEAAADSAFLDRVMRTLATFHRASRRYALDVYLAGWPGPRAIVDAAVRHGLAAPTANALPVPVPSL